MGPARDLNFLVVVIERGDLVLQVELRIENRRDLIDAEYALNEGGGGAIKDGTHQLNSVQASEKVYQSFTLTANNPGGHSSLPRSDNAIYDLANALVRVGEYHFPVMLNEVTEAYFRGTADVEGGPIGADIRAACWG